MERNRRTPRRFPRVQAACALFLWGGAAGLSAQDSQPSDPVAAIGPVMTELRKGAWDGAKAKSVLDTLIAADLQAAASWWIAEIDDAIKAKKLPPATQAALNAARKRCDHEGATDDDRKLVSKLVRHLESLAASRNFDEAKPALKIAKAALVVAPDAATARALGALEPKIMAGSGAADPSNLARQRKQWEDLVNALKPMMLARLDRLEAEYARAGCRAGRRSIESVLRGSAALFHDKEADARIRKLRVKAREVEPSKTLSITARAHDPVRAFLDGAECRALGGSIVAHVLPGDLVQIEVPRYSGLLPDGKNALHAAAVAMTLDDAPVSRKNMFVNSARDRDLLDPPLGKFEFKRAKPGDRALAEFGNMSGAFAKHGAFVAMGPEGTPLAYAVGEECVGYEKDLGAESAAFFWVGGIAESVVVVVKIPEP